MAISTFRELGSEGNSDAVDDESCKDPRSSRTDDEIDLEEPQLVIGEKSRDDGSPQLQGPAPDSKVDDSRDLVNLSRPLVHEDSRIEQVVESPPGSPGVEPHQTLSPVDGEAANETLLVGMSNPALEGALQRQSSPGYMNTVGKSRRSRSPLVLASVSTAADPQSSPASTNGPGSSNTPDPTAGSPTTSPGDEVPPAGSRSFSIGEKPERPAGTPKPGRPGYSQTDIRHYVQLPNDHHSPPAEPTGPNDDIEMSSPRRPPPDDPDSTNFSRSADPSSEPTLRKPSMRIDTQTSVPTDTRVRGSAGIVESPAPMTSSTTRKAPGSASTNQSPNKRETRISSGVLERKSVSEILGETPKPTSPQVDKSIVESPTREDFEAATARGRLADRENREKERSKLSTVIFAKPQSGDQVDSTELVRNVGGEVVSKPVGQRDYLHTLFESKAYSPPRSLPLTALLQSAHKTLSTVDHLVDYQEQMNCRTLKRIYQLQNANRWPLRQMQRAPEPARQTSHWDFLLDHAKWMRTDFREERKWKLAAARGVAEWCAEWVAGDAEERLKLQVQVKAPRLLPAAGEAEDVIMDEEPGPALSLQPTPELVASAEEDSISDGYVEDPKDVPLQNAPAAIFSLGSSEFSYPISKTPAADKLLNELPLYEPARIEPDVSKSDLAERSDAKWKTDILPISKYATGKLRFQEPKPPSKRSRYDYLEDNTIHKDQSPLPAEQVDVALFMPENKHIRDRIHPGHSFRPPSEYPMPSQAFFESRSSSQWTHTEDDELRKFVKEFSYNWSLISSCLSPRSIFVSGADRRTPWECFERWIGLEGLPADMSKTPYFRAYHSRIEAAGRHVIAQQEAALRQAGNGIQITPRKRTTQPVRVERKRTQRHLAMLDAMRKLAKKRETALQKQQHAADLAAMRKVNEANQPRPPISTPAEFSRLKHEREIKMAERQEQYRQQVLAHQKAAMQQRSQLTQANGFPHGLARTAATMPQNSNTAPLNGMPNGNHTGGNMTGQPRPHPAMQGMPHSTLPNGSVPANMMGLRMSQGQIQAAGRGMAGHSPENMRAVYAEVARVQQQQQQILATQARQGMAQNSSHSPPNMSGASVANSNSNNSAILAALATTNGALSPSVAVNGTSGSPRANNSSTIGQSLSSGHMPAISQLAANIQARHPEMPPEEVQRQATQHLTIYQKQAAQAAASQAGVVHQAQKSAMNQAALNAAAGALNAAHIANNAYPRGQGMMTNEQVQAYNQQMRQQQALQRANGIPGSIGIVGMGAGSGGGMVGGMTGSPVLNMARPVSQHASQGQMSRSATPRDQRSGSNGINGVQGSPRGGQQGTQT